MVNVGEVYIHPFNGEKVVVIQTYINDVELSYINVINTDDQWLYTANTKYFIVNYKLCPKFMLQRKLLNEKKIS